MLASASIRRLIVPLLLGLGILATLGREVTFANFLGTSRDLEVFRLAFALPNLLSQSLAPAYIGALLPLLIAAQQRSVGEYAIFCRRLARVTVGSVLILAVIGVVSVSLQSSLLAPGFDAESQRLLARALAVCWAFFLFTGLSFLPRLFLNSRHEFWPGVSTSLIISSVLVVACIATSGRYLSVAAVIAGGVILMLHLLREPQPVLMLLKKSQKPVAPDPASEISILKPLVLVLLIHVSNAIPRFIDRAFATDFPQGIVAALEYSYNIITVPGILLGTSVITIFYPSFVRRVQDKDLSDLHRSIVVPMLLTIGIAFIVGLGLYFVSVDVISVVYGRGAFGETAIQSTATLLSWHALGLGFMVATLILMQACLAYGVFRVLLIIALVRIVTKYFAITWLVPQFQLDGLGASFIVPEVVSTVLLLALLFVLKRTPE